MFTCRAAYIKQSNSNRIKMQVSLLAIAKKLTLQSSHKMKITGKIMRSVAKNFLSMT